MKKRFVVKVFRHDEAGYNREISRKVVEAYSRADAIAVSGVEETASACDRVAVEVVA